MRELSGDLGSAFRAELIERLETQERANRGLMYRMFGEIADPPDEAGMAPAMVTAWPRDCVSRRTRSNAA
jgi:hypothetical protein